MAIEAKGVSLAATRLFLVAKTACERLKMLDSSTRGGQDDALIAIVFSAASLEAYLNELPEQLFLSTNPPCIPSYVHLADEVEANKGSVKLKYLLAYSILSGQTCDKGKSPYQDFSLLIDVRNELMHAKPSNFSTVIGPDHTIQYNENKKIIEKLRDKGILDIEPLHFIMPITNEEGVKEEKLFPLPIPWHHQVSTRAAADWACKTVTDVVESLANVIPDSRYKSTLQRLSQQFRRAT